MLIIIKLADVSPFYLPPSIQLIIEIKDKNIGVKTLSHTWKCRIIAHVKM